MFSLFKLNLLGWHWLITLYRFQVYISMIHDLQIALCAHHLRSNHLPSPYVWPLLLPSTPFPLVTTILLSVSMSFCLFFLLVHLLLSVLYSTCGWNHMVLDIFHLTYFSLHDILKIHPCCHKWKYFIFSYGWVGFQYSLSNLLFKDTSAVSISWPLWKVLQ